MDQSIGSGCCGHRVFEDAVPLGKNEVARDHDAATLVALRKEGKEHLHLVACCTPDVVENHLEAVEIRCFPRGSCPNFTQ